MDATLYLIAVILVMAGATLLTRALPFLLFARGAKHPTLLYLGRVLPPAVMTLLLLYCLKDVSLAAAPHGLPEALALAAVVGLHLWRRNALLSIGAGTGLYMFLVQNGVFG
ncbi:MAG: branched-chain amino acid transporter permease [Gammaproteobacteria bacterium]|nr:branched-chain amino acid transporter permease [Gammaproteobacteria bacterium]